MKINIAGNWGAGLGETESSRAFAALGILEAAAIPIPAGANPRFICDMLQEEIQNGERTAVWGGIVHGPDQPPGFEEIPPDAATLARAWHLLLAESPPHPRSMPRLAIPAYWRHRPDLFDFDSLFDLLGRGEIGLQALVMVPEHTPTVEPRAVWHWPLKIGVPATTAGEKLLAELRTSIGTGWLGQLGQLLLVGEARDACDLLIVPSGMADQLAQQPNLRIRASFIVCLDDPPLWSNALDAPAAKLLEKIGAAGIALVGNLDSYLTKTWYREFIRALSHDLPVHAALWGVGLYNVNKVPIIVGYPTYLDRLRILTIAQRFDHRWRLMQDYYEEEIPYEISGPVFESTSKSGLAGVVRKAAFTSEEGYGLPIARNFIYNRSEFERRRQPRWIQAGVWHAASQAEPARAIAPDQPNLIAVHIGPTTEERSDKPFPDDAFDFRDGPIPLTVQFELAGASIATFESTGLRGEDAAGDSPESLFQLLQQAVAAPEPLAGGHPLIGLATESITLPEFGASTPATFVAWPQEGVSKVKGRIAIIHQNRVIQEANFEAAVAHEAEAETEIVVQVDNVVHPRYDDLSERQVFDAALIAADDNERLRLTINKNGVGKQLFLEDVQAAIKSIRKIVTEVTRREEDALDMMSDSTGRVLYSLAFHGALLYDLIREAWGESIDDIERIQLLSSGRMFFPLEYIYNGPSPQFEAQLCPNAPVALKKAPSVLKKDPDAHKKGYCGGCENEASGAFICPLHFWGFRKIIERHANTRLDSDDRLYMPVPTRTPFGPLTPGLFAASDKAFDFTSGDESKESLLASLAKMGAPEPQIAAGWTSWKKLVETIKPEAKLLVLLPHSDTVPIDVEVLELGQQDLLPKNLIKKELVGEIETPKLLLLLGCSTADATKSFAPYPELFRKAGADIIVAPLAPILGADAAPIARLMAELLAARSAGGAETTLGEILRDIRCQLLAEGFPGVLGLLCFGDADWIFGGNHAAT